MKLKPLEAFLADIHPEVVERGVTLITGHEIEFGKVNQTEVKRLVREHYAEGQKVLKEFNQWLVRAEGFTQFRANRTTAMVWNTLCMTFNPETKEANPITLVNRDDETYSFGMKRMIAYNLRFWARYRNDSALYEKLLAWKDPKPKKTSRTVAEQVDRSPPYTFDEYHRLLKAVNEFKKSSRYPWAWPCLRLVFTQGASLLEVAHLKRSSIIAVLQTRQEVLRIGMARTSRIIQVPLVEEELHYLLTLPYGWTFIGDIFDPNAKQVLHKAYTTLPFGRVVREVFKRAGVPFSPNWYIRVRWTAAWLYYKKTNDLVSTTQILGFRDMRKVQRIFEELKRREEAATAAGKEINDEALDVEADRGEVGDG
jgi:hypothetical protein